MNADGKGDAGERLQCKVIARAVLGEPMGHAGAELLWHCPNHDDQHPSLSLNPQKNVWFCGPCGKGGTAWQLAAFIAGVDPGDKAAVKAWLKERGLLSGKSPRAKRGAGYEIVETYNYLDTQGRACLRKHRLEAEGKEKTFEWEHLEQNEWVKGRGGLQPALYRSNEIKNAVCVQIHEGERKVNKAFDLGFFATCIPDGAKSWSHEYANKFTGKHVSISPDNDDTGRTCAHITAADIFGCAMSVRIVNLPGLKEKGDIVDWLASGGTREQLEKIIAETPEWKPETGAEILDAVVRFVRRFVSLTEAQARAVTVWVAHTHAFDAADCTPYLDINSAEKQSGKTRLLEVLRSLVFCAWFTGRVTAAVLTRKIDAEHPTLLLDESDAAFGGEKDYAEALRGILDTGYRRGGAASCCIGQGASITYKDFSTFCPKAIAGIGRLPDTVADRSIPIRLKRARRGEVERLREREAQREGSAIAARLGAWCGVSVENLRKARPEIPQSLSDRQADVCEPLLAIADLAGGGWPEAAKKALVELCAGAQVDDDSVGVWLLRDIKAAFAEKHVTEMSSADLAAALAEVEGSPWGEWSKGKPLSQSKLARLLKPFDVRPDRIGGKDSRLRGYAVEWFNDAFSRYLPPKSVHPSTTRENSGDREDFKLSTKDAVDTYENAVSHAENAGCGHVDTFKPGIGGEEHEPRILFADDREAI